MAGTGSTCRHHTINGTELIRIFEYKNLTTGQVYQLWVNGKHQITCQTLRKTTCWYGCFVEEENIGMLRLAFHTSGNEDRCESAVLLVAAPNRYEGLDGNGRDITLRYRRSMQICSLCSDWYVTECALDDRLPAVVPDETDAVVSPRTLI